MTLQTTTFKGARYLVKFHDPIEWASTESYEAIEAVQHEAFTYISKQPVPAGVQIDNTDFWLLWVDPNAQMEQLRELVEQYVDNVEDLTKVTTYSFDTASDMKLADNLVTGMICHTNGFHSSGDGGSAWYEITDTGTANEMDVIACGELFAQYIYDNELNPQKFGAKSSKTNNDASNIVNHCLDYLSNIGSNEVKNLYLISDLYINDSIYVPNGVNIIGQRNNEKTPTLYRGNNADVVIYCNEAQNTLANFAISAYGRIYETYTGIELNGINGIGYDIDSVIENVTVAYADKGIVIKGRNVDVINSTLSHCKYGVYFDIPADAFQVRGLNIQNTRFHGIGEEQILQYENSACVYINTAIRTNLTIKNCIADQSGTFFSGFASEIAMQDNFVETWVKPCIDVAHDGTTQQLGAYWFIEGNVFIGNSGVDPLGVNRSYPENIINLNKVNRINFVGNKFSKASSDLVNLVQCTEITFSSNTFGYTSGTGKHAVKADANCRTIKMYNNNAENIASIGLIDKADAVTLDYGGNFNFATGIFATSIKNGYTTTVKRVNVASGTTGTPISFNPAEYGDEFVITFGSDRTYRITRFSNTMFTEGVFWLTSTNVFEICRMSYDTSTNETYISSIRVNPSTGEVENASTNFTIYAIVNV